MNKDETKPTYLAIDQDPESASRRELEDFWRRMMVSLKMLNAHLTMNFKTKNDLFLPLVSMSLDLKENDPFCMSVEGCSMSDSHIYSMATLALKIDRKITEHVHRNESVLSAMRERILDARAFLSLSNDDDREEKALALINKYKQGRIEWTQEQGTTFVFTDCKPADMRLYGSDLDVQVTMMQKAKDRAETEADGTRALYRDLLASCRSMPDAVREYAVSWADL